MNRWTTNLSWIIVPTVFLSGWWTQSDEPASVPASPEPSANAQASEASTSSTTTAQSTLTPATPSASQDTTSLADEVLAEGTSGESEKVWILPSELSVEAIESLPDSVKEALQRRRQLFESLTDSERSSLRDLHQQLTAHPQAEQLERVLVNYNRWLESLTSIQRAELADMSIEARIEKIKEIKHRQEEEMLQKLADRAVTSADIEAIVAWAGERSLQYEERLTELLPSSMRNPPPNRRPSDEPNRSTPRFWLFSFQLSDLNEILNDDDLTALTDRLTPSAADVLKREMTREQRLEQVVRWLMADLISRMRPAPEVLEAFFRDELNDQERADLDQRSPQDRMEALRDLYLRRKFPRNRGRGPFSPPGGFSGQGGNR